MNGASKAALGLLAVGIAVVIFVAGVIGVFSLVAGYSRSQALKNANNRVKVTAINIRNAQQQAKVIAANDATVHAQADQRAIAADGVRRAQDKIQATLTPLYVQWEAIQAQLAMAHSQNSTVIYVPSGANGVPLVRDTSGDAVTAGR